MDARFARPLILGAALLSLAANTPNKIPAPFLHCIEPRHPKTSIRHDNRATSSGQNRI